MLYFLHNRLLCKGMCSVTGVHYVLGGGGGGGGGRKLDGYFPD